METDDAEHRTLNSLNSRFELYLQRIKTLADLNQKLHEQIENFRKNSVKSSTNSSISSLKQFRELCDKINDEVRQNAQMEIRCQRAQFDQTSVGNRLKAAMIEENDDRRQFEYEFDSKQSELTQWKKHFETRRNDLQKCKIQYDETLKSLIDVKTRFDSIVAERIQIEQKISNLQNELLIERLSHRRRKDEFKWIETISADFNRKFNQTEFEEIFQRIRDDYQKFNETQIKELEVSYQTNFEDLTVEFEENQLLERQIDQLENEFQRLNIHRQDELKRLNNEIDKIQTDFLDVESLINDQRQTNVQLSTEIRTYRTLLVNFSAISIEQATGFEIHENSQLIWVRI